MRPGRRRSEDRPQRPAQDAPKREVRGDFYSPVPDLEALDESVWSRRSDLAGIEFDSAAQMDWAERELAGFIAEFTDPPGFRLDNTYYESVDAEVADAMVRWARPARVVELGSGWSTLILRAAGEAVGAAVSTYDPFPAPFLGGGVRAVRAQDVPQTVFSELGPGDILFVDTSHTVKLDSDVNRIVLDVLPRLAPGVIVHFHDIWTPYEYHRHLVEFLGMFWAEQYLLQAFLIGNGDWEVLFAAQALAREQGDRLGALVPSYTGESFPSCFWLRRRS